MDLFSQENIINYTNDSEAKYVHKYPEEILKIRKELRKLEQNTKKDGGVIYWNRMLNDFM